MGNYLRVKVEIEPFILGANCQSQHLTTDTESKTSGKSKLDTG